MNRTKQTAANIITNAAGYLAPLLVNFITTPILLRFVGEDGYGLQNLALVISGYLAVMDLGMDIPITKFLAGDHAQGDYRSANRLLNTTLILYLLIGLGGFFLVFLGSDLLVNTVFDVPGKQISAALIIFQLAGAGFALNLLGSWGRAALCGMQRFDIASAIRVSTLVGASVAGIIALYMGYGLTGFVLVRVVSYGVSTIALFYYTYHLIPYFRINMKIDLETLRRVKSYVGVGFLLRAAAFITTGLDRALMGMWVSVSVVAVYAIQWSIITPSGGLLNSISAVFFPMVSELHATGRLEELKDIFRKLSRFSAAWALLIFSMLFIYGDVFLRLWVGGSIAEKSRYILPLCILSSMVGFLTQGLVNEVLVGMGKLRTFSVYIIARAAVLAVGFLIFIPWFGLIGAGLAFPLASLVDVCMFVFALKRYLGIQLGEFFRYAYMYPFFLSAFMCTVGLLVKPYVDSWVSLVITVGSLSIAYIVGAFATGILGETEKKVVSHFGNVLLKTVKR